MPLWISAEQAEAEGRDESDPDDGPLFLSIDYLLQRLSVWSEAGVEEAGLQSGHGGRFLLTIPPAELADRLKALRSGQRPAFP